MHRRLASTTLAVAAAIALPAAAQAAPTTIAPAHGGTELAAAGTDVAWSQYDEATKRWALVLSRNGAPAAPLAVPERSTPFDVDLGTDRSGQVVAVYSRCATDAEGGTGCDLHSVSSAPGATERKLTRLSSASRDERDPTVEGGKVAFVRDQPVRGAVGQTLRLGSLSPSGRVRTLATTTAKQGRVSDPELAGTHIAYVVSARGRYEFGAQSVHVRPLSGSRVRSVYTATSGGANVAGVTNLSHVTGTSSTFLFARTNQGSGKGNRLLTYDARSGRFRKAQGNANYSSVGSRADGDVVAVRDYLGGQDAASAVLDLGSPAFTAGDR